MSYFWVSVEKIGLLLIRLVLIIVLSRFLTPNDFGLFAMVNFIVVFSNIIIDSGLSGALIQKKNISNIYYNTTFTFNIVISLLLSSIIYLSATYISVFYNQYELENIVKVLAMTIFIKSLATTQIAIMTKHLQFKLQTIIFLLSAIISTIIGILIAINGYGYWSLIYIQLIESLLIVIFFWAISNYRPKLQFSTSCFINLYSFGGRLMLSSIISAAYSNIINIIIGKKFGSNATGYYFQAQRISDLYNNTLTLIVDKTIFPTLSKCESKEELYHKSKAIIPTLCLVAFSFPTFIFLNSKEIVHIVLGNGWEYAANILPILIASSYGLIIESYLRCFMKSLGEGKIILQLEIIKRFIGITLLIISSSYGLTPLIYTVLLLSILNALINIWSTSKILQKKIIDILSLSIKALAINITLLIFLSYIFRFINGDLIKLLFSASIIFPIPLYYIVKIYREKNDKKQR
ncbi:lipopolysaccharide biosynthesis protein [Providencia sp. 2024EL-00732]|uniref:lipopolysaccharide biosynthesis protein n=1 Tax=Providencia sp. 2024EL-00732 TaxID=3374242 RepID=UPI0024AAD4D3|nr:lipopolysaccharide biosynthesis protein [Providencia rettgeri]